MSPTATIIVQLLSSAADKNKRQNLFLILVIPLAFIAVVLLIFTYKTADDNDAYNKAVLMVKDDCYVSNSLDGNLIRCIWLVKNGDINDDAAAVAEFIEKNFVEEITETYIDHEGAEQTVTYNAFKPYFAIIKMLSLPPFEFDNDKIELVKLYELSGTPSYETGNSSGEGKLPIAIKFPMPASGYVSSAYGTRINPITGEPGAMHYGMDIRGEHYQPISAIASGKVKVANTKKSGYGNYVIIEHDIEGIKFYSLYAHLSKLHVAPGDVISQGDIIGLEGGEPNIDNNAGDSTGHHLHFELRLSSTLKSAIDPAPYLY